MSTAAERVNFRIRPNQKQLISQAAAASGQTVSKFAVRTLLRESRKILRESGRTRLSDRDRDIFLAMLDDVDRKPNQALIEAAEFYKAYLASDGHAG
jgi:uncharacterized protein (DUF1778 family)